MSLGGLCWGIVLAGLPWAHFLLSKQLDTWHAQTLWMHLGLVGLVALMGVIPPQRHIRNFPLALWSGWVTGMTLWWFTMSTAHLKQYPIQLLMPLGHLLLALAAYRSFVHLVSRDDLTCLLRWVATSGAFVVGYGVLQLLGMDQFYRNADNAAKDLLVGTIGNPTHFGSHLALLLPLVWLQPGRRWRGLLVILCVMLLLTKSITGVVAGAAALAWCLGWTTRRGMAAWVLGVGSLAAVGFASSQAHLVFSASGRWEAWQTFWSIFTAPYQGKPLTGFGPGFIMQLSQVITEPSSTIYHWRHVHNEYLQVAMEQGVVGLGLLLWAVWGSWRRVLRAEKTREVIALSGTWLAFLLLAAVNFPAHLWLLGSYGLLAYAGIEIVTES